MKKIIVLLLVCALFIRLSAKPVSKSSVLEAAERVFDWQQAHPTGVNLWEWEYGAYYSGLMDLYKVDPKIKYLKAMTDMGNQYKWKVHPRQYDANILAIAHMYLDLSTIIGDSPASIKPDDSEAYGSGAFLMAASEVYKLLEK